MFNSDYSFLILVTSTSKGLVSCSDIFKIALQRQFSFTTQFCPCLVPVPVPGFQTHQKYFIYIFFLNLNLNQARGPYQLSWTLTFRVSTFRQTSSIGSTQPQPHPQPLPEKRTKPTQLDLDFQSEHIQTNQFYWINSCSSSTSTKLVQLNLNFHNEHITVYKFIGLHKGNFRRSF